MSYLGRPFARLGAALALGAVVLATACTGGAGPSSASPQSGGAPTSGGTVTIPIVADPTLNPWSPNAFVESIFVNRVLFDGLTRPGKDLAPAPDLATSWETSADGLAWTFHLREGVKWSDGRAFTADDVAFTFNDVVLKKELGANGAGNYSALKRVAVVDPKTARFELIRPFAALPSYLAYNSGLLPKHV
ncbi:MAG: ABC transporter substrate-binding protein, partial [Chloroflexota bacterium]